MLKASSLFYALAISVLIALVSSAVLSCAYFSGLSTRRDKLKEDVLRNARSGIELLLADEINDFSSPVETDLFGDGGDSVCLQKKSWGIFEVAVSKAHHGIFKNEMLALAGYAEDGNDHAALVLADLDRPLRVCGNTKLKGDCFLPAAGIQRAYIEGQNYTGEKLVYGEIKKADRFLPGLNEKIITSLQQLFNFRPGESSMNEAEFQNTDSLSNSFSSDPLYVFSPGEIIIRSQFIHGQIMIISKRSIHVTAGADIQNAILVAPYIKIDDHVKGKFQAFASDSLFTGEKTQFSYPSVLGLIANDKSPALACLQLGEESEFCGVLFACTSSKNFQQHVLIRAGNKSKLYGEIFSADLAELKGAVYGKATCAKLELKTASAVYENHLLNTTIDRPGRARGFVTGLLLNGQNKKTVAAWLE